MTTFLLIRHGEHTLGGGTLAGRLPGVTLSENGVRQIHAMVARVAHLNIRALYSSPVERTLQTAKALADRLQLPVTQLDALSEVDYGEWSGKTLDAMSDNTQWKHWNTLRSCTRVPGGERMLAIQHRAVSAILDLAELHPGWNVGVVSHGDVIRAIVAYLLGVPLDLMLRIEISLASVSAVRIEPGFAQVLFVNAPGDTLPD